MADLPDPPKSPTLLPPRKSVELEDPGAHELEHSENEDDVFSDAPEGQGAHSGPSSPIPITRVEKVDDRDSYGELPRTAAYKMREQDAVPDELEIIPDGSDSRPSSRTSHKEQVSNPGGMPIPKTVVEKVDPASPSHGDVPRTAAHSIRRADAVPDIILQAPEHGETPFSDTQGNGISPEVLIPTTVITKVDSEPSHGEVPGTDAFEIRKGDAKPDVVEKKGDVSGKPWNALLDAVPMTESDLPTNSVSRSKLFKPKRTKQPDLGASPIAADGGFGPMEEEGSYNESEENDDHDADDDANTEADECFAEDFDDFEAGAENEDFGSFDDGFEEPSVPGEGPDPEPVAPSVQSIPHSRSPFPLLDFSELDTLDDIITATNPYLDKMFPSTKEASSDAPDPPTSPNSIFLTDRSLSLWSQLVAPPPLQPPNWVRSRIRRLFLVSLGVPVDLDEILPASKQKKLILPSIHLRNGSQSPPGDRGPGSRVRLNDNASSTSVDQPSTTKTNRKRKGPPLPPDMDLQATRMLCGTTEAALSNMTDDELRAHIKKVELLTTRASEVLEYWLKRRDSALGDKEAFEGVIENLVKHARRVRK